MRVPSYALLTLMVQIKAARMLIQRFMAIDVLLVQTMNVKRPHPSCPALIRKGVMHSSVCTLPDKHAKQDLE